MVTISPDVFATLLVMSFLLVFWLLWRLFHPMECTCKFSTHFVWRFKRHILMKHGWK